MYRRIGFLSLLLLGLAAPLQAAGNGPAEAWTALRAEAAARLAALAGEAQGRKLYRTRDEVFEKVLLFDPDHAKARSWLKFKRRSGDWVRSRYTRPRDRGSRSARDQQATSAASWRAWWQQEILRVHEQAGAAGASRVQADVLRFALEFESEDPVIRALAGEARYGEGADTRWILLDTERALAHRAAFLETAREAARNVGPARRGRPRTEDRSDRVAWPTVLEGETVRVLGAASPEELQRHLEIAESAAAVFSRVFGIPAKLPSEEGAAEPTFPLYVTTTRAQGNAFLATEPGVGGEALALLASLDVAFLPERPGAIVKTAQDSLRLEATVHAVQAHLTRPHLGHEPGACGAWAQETVALYLAWLQVRTRELCTTEAPTAETGPAAPTGPFGRPRHDAASGPVQIGDVATDWHARAAEAIRDLTLDELRLMTAKRPSDLDALDLLAGYGLVVYVLEAHPGCSAAFFRAVATERSSALDKILTKHLGRDLVALRPHLLRWLDEMGELAPPPGEPR